MSKERFIIQICVALSIMLLPFAHLKATLFGMPLYSVEMPVGVALAVYAYGCWKGTFSPLENIALRNPFVLWTGLFFVGALTSFLLNPFSWTGLGMIKTWFVVPLLLVWLWLETKPERRTIDMMLLLWLGVVALASLAGLEYFFQGVVTFDGRLSAWYASPNYLAAFLAPGILLVQYFSSHSLFENKKGSKITLGFILFSLLLALFFTHSYAVWLSIFGASLLFLFLSTQHRVFSGREKWVFCLLIILFVTFLFFESGSEKWQALISLHERSSLSSRMMIWQTALTAASNHPFFGIGIGRFQEVYLSYQSQFPLYLEWAVPQPHNLYLALWLQTGMVGLFGFLLLISAWLKEMFFFKNIFHQTEDRKKRSALLVALLSFFLLLGFVDTPFFKTDLAFIFWLILSLGMSLTRR